jgi:hypothetical protein
MGTGTGSGDGGSELHTLTVEVGGSATGVITSTPSGLTCTTGTCTQMFAAGTQITLNQAATSGAFLGWSNDCAGGGSCVVTMDTDHTVGALFGTPGQALWSQQFGGTSDEYAHAIVADSAGNLIVVGEFQGSFTVGATTYTSNGGRDIFVAKLSTSTGAISWIKTMGGSDQDIALVVAVDASNDIYVAGSFSTSVDFGGGVVASSGNTDGFAFKLTSAGAFAWAKPIGGSGFDSAWGIAVRGETVAVVGSFQASMIVNGTTQTSGGADDGFLVEYGRDGTNGLVRTMTGAANQDPRGVAIDSAGSVVIVGTAGSPSDFGGGAVTTVHDDVFLAKYNGSTGAYLFAKVLGGSSFDVGSAVAVDPSDNIFVVGLFTGSVAFGGAAPVNANTNNTCIAKYSLAGSYQWAGCYGDTTATVAPGGVAVNASGDVALAGDFCGTLSLGSASLSSVGSCAQSDHDIFAVRLAGSNGTPINSTRAGGSMLDIARGVAQTADGRYFAAGGFQGFAEFGGQGRTSLGGYDVIVLGLAPL